MVAVTVLNGTRSVNFVSHHHPWHVSTVCWAVEASVVSKQTVVVRAYARLARRSETLRYRGHTSQTERGSK